MKVSYADYENKTSEALADTMDCSVHKKPVIYDDKVMVMRMMTMRNMWTATMITDMRMMQRMMRTATIMFRIMKSTNSLTQQGLRADQH